MEVLFYDDVLETTYSGKHTTVFFHSAFLTDRDREYARI